MKVAAETSGYDGYDDNDGDEDKTHVSLDRALAALSTPAYVADDRGIIIARNAALSELTGLPCSEIIDQDAHDLIHRNEFGEPVARSQCRLREATLAGRTEQGAGVWIQHTDGQLIETGWLTTRCDVGAPAPGALVILQPLPDEESEGESPGEGEASLGPAGSGGAGGRRTRRGRRPRLHGRPFVEVITPPVLETGTLTELARLELLAETTTLLTSTLDRHEALRRLMHLLVPRLADWVVVDLITEQDVLIRYAVAHHEPTESRASGDSREAPQPQETPARRDTWDSPELVRKPDLEGPMPPVPEGSPSPLPRALRGAASAIIGPETYEGPLASGIEIEQRRLFHETGMHSAMVAPILGVRRVLGALTLGRSEQPELYTAPDLLLLEDIARRAGLALENVLLYERQREVGQIMQQYLLPHLPRIPGLEITARYLPAPESSEVGGDWYDAFLTEDGVLSLAIGDVVGHDLEAAAGMAQLRNMLRAYSLAQEHPSTLVEWLDNAALHFGEVSMATLVYARLTEAGGRYELRWTNAGHPPPLLVSHEGVARYLTKGHGTLIGLGIHSDRTDATVVLPPGSTLVLYTDGLIEAPGCSIDDGLKHLRRHAASLAHRPLDAFTDLLLERSRPPRNEDDVAVLAVRIPHEPKAPYVPNATHVP